jgi:hypothetical protein
VSSTPPRLSGDPDHRGRHRLDDPDDPESSMFPAQAPDRADVAWLSNYVVSVLRTVVPLAWGAGLSFLLTQWPAAQGPLEVLSQAGVDPAVVLTSVLTAAWYIVWRWLEPHLPRIPTALVLGHADPPEYPTT